MVDQILMKFEVWKDIMSQSYYFKYPPDLVTLEGVGDARGNLKSKILGGNLKGPP